MLYLRKSQVLIGQSLRFEQEPEPVNGMLEIGLRRALGLLLKVEQIVVDLFRVELRREFAKIQRDRRYMAGIIVEGTYAPAQNRNGTLKTVQQFGEPGNFALGPVDELVFP